MLVNDEPPLWREETTDFLDKAAEFDILISPVVLEEIENAHSDVSVPIIERIDSVRPELLSYDEEIGNLVNIYIDRGIFPRKQRNDALHVAYASYYDCDVLLSFNFRHIVKYDIKNEVKAANILQGYNTPGIYTPMYLL